MKPFKRLSFPLIVFIAIAMLSCAPLKPFSPLIHDETSEDKVTGRMKLYPGDALSYIPLEIDIFGQARAIPGVEETRIAWRHIGQNGVLYKNERAFLIAVLYSNSTKPFDISQVRVGDGTEIASIERVRSDLIKVWNYILSNAYGQFNPRGNSYTKFLSIMIDWNGLSDTNVFKEYLFIGEPITLIPTPRDHRSHYSSFSSQNLSNDRIDPGYYLKEKKTESIRRDSCCYAAITELLKLFSNNSPRLPFIEVAYTIKVKSVKLSNSDQQICAESDWSVYDWLHSEIYPYKNMSLDRKDIKWIKLNFIRGKFKISKNPTYKITIETDNRKSIGLSKIANRKGCKSISEQDLKYIMQDNVREIKFKSIAE